MKTFCFKLYKSEHNAKLHAQINAAALTYNHCIALHKRYYKIFGKYLMGDLGFSDFVKILKYEATKFSTVIKEVGRYFASSQLCSNCGEKNPLVKDLKIRKWKCKNCGAEHERDRNAAINILQKGLGQRPMQ